MLWIIKQNTLEGKPKSYFPNSLGLHQANETDSQSIGANTFK